MPWTTPPLHFPSSANRDAIHAEPPPAFALFEVVIATTPGNTCFAAATNAALAFFKTSVSDATTAHGLAATVTNRAIAIRDQFTGRMFRSACVEFRGARLDSVRANAADRSGSLHDFDPQMLSVQT